MSIHLSHDDLALIMVIVGTISSVCATWAAWVGLGNRKKIKEIHVLVNNRLDAALERIAKLQEDLRISKGKERS
jgi:hypothetical protein